MVPGKHNLTVFRGGTYNIGITAKNDLGVAMLFNGYGELRMEIREPWAYALGEKPEPVLTLTEASGLTVTDLGEGLTIHISAADTELLTFEKGVYVIEMAKTEDDGEITVDKLLYGYITVKGEDIV